MSKFIIDFDGSIIVEADSKDRATEALWNRLSAIGVNNISFDNIEKSEDDK